MALLCLRFVCSLFINTAVFLLRGCEFEQLGAAVGLVSFCGWRTGSSVPMLGRLRFSGHVLWDGLWPALGRSAESSSTFHGQSDQSFLRGRGPPCHPAGSAVLWVLAVIEDAGGNLKIVNNSDIRNLQNRSKNSSLAVCDIGVSYETDIEKLRDVLGAGLATIREKHPDLFLSDPLYKGIERFEDSSIVLRFTAETKEDDIFVAKRCLNEEIYSLLKANKISIPFPQVVVHPSR